VNAREWFYGPQGFGSTRGNVPTAATVVKTDAAMAAIERNECPFCWAPLDEEGFCTNQECR
jgi:hypothetical protein